MMTRRTAVGLLTALVLTLPHAAGALMTLRPGEMPPTFDLADLAGTRVGPDVLAGRASVVLFWSTWSPRSAEMLEDFKRHASAYAAQGLKIVAINVDGENLGAAQRAAIREYAAERALPFPVLLDDGLKTFAAWGVMAHPTEVVLDAGGRIAYVLPGYPLSLREELEDAIRKALGIPVTPQRGAPPSVGFVPQGMALQHFNLGRRLLAAGDHDKALAAFRRAATADPGFLEAAVMTARVALAFGNRAEAEQLARQVSPEMINRGDLRYLLGSMMLTKGDLDAAERAFRGLSERLPQEGWGAWGLGQVALARGDRAGALALFKDARALQDDNPEGEEFVRRHFRDRWLRRESSPEDDGFVAVFPSLGEIRERYRKLFGAVDAPAPAAP
jgi:tetratricopeptide (TPR) repeat protein